MTKLAKKVGTVFVVFDQRLDILDLICRNCMPLKQVAQLSCAIVNHAHSLLREYVLGQKFAHLCVYIGWHAAHEKVFRLCQFQSSLIGRGACLLYTLIAL